MHHDSITQRILQLQQRVTNRLSEFAYADLDSAIRIGRHTAEIAVLGERFANVTLPLFLTLNRENRDAVAEVILAIKSELDELRDALVDSEQNVAELVEFFHSGR
jgi:hypothetical protein